LLSKAPRFDSVNIGGNENEPDSGIKIAQGKDGNVLKLSKKGADGKDGKVILRGLADGKDDSDAVTKSQLDEVRNLAKGGSVGNIEFITDDNERTKLANNELNIKGDGNIKTSKVKDGEIKLSLGDEISFGGEITNPDGTKTKTPKITLGKDGLTTTGADGKAGPSITADGIDGGNKKLTNLASGLNGKTLEDIKKDIEKANGDPTKMPKEASNAATIGDLATVDGKIVNVSTSINNIIGDTYIKDDGNGNKTIDVGKIKEDLATNAASGQQQVVADGKGAIDTIVNSIKNINTQGTRFFHVNDGHQVKGTGKDEHDSSADSKGGVAIGMQAKVGNNAENAISIGTKSQVSVAGGVALGSYSQANRKALSDAEKQEVYLAKNTDVANTVKNTKGAISVGKSGEDGFTRQITGVAAGTEDSDAVNVAQLKAVQKVANQGSKWIAANTQKFDKNGKIVDNSAQAEAKGVNSVAIGASSNTQVVSNGNIVERPNTVSVGGINKDGTVTKRTISNVAPGVLNSDAATMGQLRAGLNDVYGKLGEYKKRASAGTASAMAIGNMPQATIPGKGMVSLGSGFYDGQSAMAIGLSKMSDDGKWVFKGSASYDSQEKAGAALSVGFHF
ncbi:YadA-like family protein, partial [Campylobacter ureolyticus]|uniref:YadA family autotransporter adhesin n=2 Tax=Campylobacter ureolyticus TaxID=827 RepID=UPI00290D865E